MVPNNKELSGKQRLTLLTTLKNRFAENMHLHHDLKWKNIQPKLERRPAKLWSLNEMEQTGGQPDVVSYDHEADKLIFFDCSPESPEGRRRVCYDREALESRTKHKPEQNAVDMAGEMGIELLTEDQYRKLQQLGDFDTKTSSWLKTPRIFGSAAAPYLVIFVTDILLSITTEHNLIMRAEDFGVR